MFHGSFTIVLEYATFEVYIIAVGRFRYVGGDVSTVFAHVDAE